MIRNIRMLRCKYDELDVEALKVETFNDLERTCPALKPQQRATSESETMVGSSIS